MSLVDYHPREAAALCGLVQSRHEHLRLHYLKVNGAAVKSETIIFEEVSEQTSNLRKHDDATTSELSRRNMDGLQS